MSTASTSSVAINTIRELLMAGDAEKALQVTHRAPNKTQELRNALGVCLLRLGRTEGAIDVLRELVFKNQLCILPDTPPLYQANYATALLLKNYNQMAIEIIKGLPVSAHPYIAELRRTIHQWQQGLPLHQWFRCLIGLYPSTPVVLNFPPGEV